MSASFSQRPDIAIELKRADAAAEEVVLLDPKYKLVSEDGAVPGDGTPKKVDIDKMHAYRDAIRDPSGRRAVRFAATLYPGHTVDYGDGISALRLYPGDESGLRRLLSRRLAGWLRDSQWGVA